MIQIVQNKNLREYLNHSTLTNISKNKLKSAFDNIHNTGGCKSEDTLDSASLAKRNPPVVGQALC